MKIENARPYDAEQLQDMQFGFDEVVHLRESDRYYSLHLIAAAQRQTGDSVAAGRDWGTWQRRAL